VEELKAKRKNDKESGIEKKQERDGGKEMGGKEWGALR